MKHRRLQKDACTLTYYLCLIKSLLFPPPPKKNKKNTVYIILKSFQKYLNGRMTDGANVALIAAYYFVFSILQN